MFISVREVLMITRFIMIQSVEINISSDISERLNTKSLKLLICLDRRFGQNI
jgi:hypothetical protein